MNVVAVLGGGAGGCAAAADLTLTGHRVRLWNRRDETIAPMRMHGVRYTGVLGEGVAYPETITTDLLSALDGADVAVACLPAVAHGPLAADLAAVGCDIPIVLNPGHTGGALHVRHVIVEGGGTPPPIAELSTLTYVARRTDEGIVNVSGKAGQVSAACLPGGSVALEAALKLFEAANPVADILATGLSNVNLVLHPPGAILSAAWVEATGGDFTFYVDAMTPGVSRIMADLDAERRAVASGFGHGLPDLLQEMSQIGTVDVEAAVSGDLLGAVRGGKANARIQGPDSLGHRYYVEDLGFGLLPLRELAAVAGVEIPVANALLTLGAALTGRDVETEGLTAERMGFAGKNRDGVLRMVRSGHSRD